MADPLTSSTEPEAVDEERYSELAERASTARLRSRPVGGVRCGGCRYYLEPSAELSYCWQPRLRILVGDDWWCQWWEPAPSPGPSA